jgi:hypothetical protein
MKKSKREQKKKRRKEEKKKKNGEEDQGNPFSPAPVAAHDPTSPLRTGTMLCSLPR